MNMRGAAMVALLTGRILLGGSDLSAPTLLAYSYSPASADISGGPIFVSGSLRIRDDLSGVLYAYITFRSPSGKLTDCRTDPQPISGTALDGTFACTATLPRYSETGAWSVAAVLAADRAGNYRTWLQPELQARGLPTALVITGIGDTDPPVLVSYSLSAESIEASGTGAVLTGTIRLTDEPAGVDYAYISLRSPSGTRLDCSTFGAPASGTRQDGSFLCSGRLPQNAESGLWQVQFLIAVDQAGNSRTWLGSYLIGRNFPVAVFVDGPGDRTPPSLVTYTFSPSNIDTSGGPRTVAGMILATDDRSGLSYGYISFRSPSGKRIDCITSDSLSSGAQLDGMFACQAEFPQYVESGRWSVSFVLLADRAGNSVTVLPPQLEARGLVTNLDVKGGQSLCSTPDALFFSHELGKAAPASRLLSVSCSALPVAFAVASDAAWLLPEVSSGVAPGEFSVSVHPEGLDAGVHHGSLTITAAGNEPSFVPATLVILPGCDVTVGLGSNLFGPAGGGGALQVLGGCGFSIAAGQNWIQPETLGPSGVLNFSVQQNDGSAPRTGTIRAGSTLFHLTQHGKAPGGDFADVPVGHPYFDHIWHMKEHGVTVGCALDPLRYCPEVAVPRRQMAVFIVRAMLDREDFAYRSTPYFADVPASDPHFKYIQKMRELGITIGCATTPALFCPEDSVTRGQMAVFVIRSLFGDAFQYPRTAFFADVRPGHEYFSQIQMMRRLGITIGCSATDYCPDAPVTRGQMAVFLIRAFFTEW